MCIPVCLSRARYHTWPSGEVLKWSSAHIILKLSSKEKELGAALEEISDPARDSSKSYEKSHNPMLSPKWQDGGDGTGKMFRLPVKSEVFEWCLSFKASHSFCVSHYK